MDQNADKFWRMRLIKRGGFAQNICTGCNRCLFPLWLRRGGDFHGLCHGLFNVHFDIGDQANTPIKIGRRNGRHLRLIRQWGWRQAAGLPISRDVGSHKCLQFCKLLRIGEIVAL